MLRATLVFGLAVLLAPRPSAQEVARTPDAKTLAAIELTSKYVESYRKELSAIVCEERQLPIEMTERYWRSDRPKEDRLEATITYSAFRRFQVTTSEIIK